MTTFAPASVLVLLMQSSGWLLAGALLGALYFWTMRWNVDLLIGRRSLWSLVLPLLRFSALALLLAIVARSFSALPLLTATLGLLAARTVALRRELRP